MKFIIEGVEEIYDEFDEFEFSKSHDPFSIEADSLEKAVESGRILLQKKICEDRFKRKYVLSEDSCGGSYGMYFANITKITDESGNILYNKEPR